MFKNSIHPITIFCTIIMGFGTFALSLGGELLRDFLRNRQYNYVSEEEFIAAIILFTVGILLFVGAIGMISRHNWARQILQVSVYTAAAGWLLLMGVSIDDFSRNFFLFLGFNAIVFSIVISALLFLNNEAWVIKEMKGQENRLRNDGLLDEQWEDG